MDRIKKNSMEIKTPYYIIHKEELDENFSKLRNALEKYWNNYIVGYSYKTNALPWVISHFNHLGCFAEVVSEEEYNLAKAVGVEENRIIYNGPIKTKESFIRSLNMGGIVNIDSQREIEWLEEIEETKRTVGIRINFNVEKMCPGQSQCGEDGGRFGFCYENGELERTIKRLYEKKAKISGIHLHTSSKSRSLDIYRAIAEIACELQEVFSLDLEYIDVGGGFFGGLTTKTQFDEYISLMESILVTRFDKKRTKLIVEPGMAIIGAPVSYVTTVLDVKETEFNRFVVTDGSRTNIDPLMTKSSYFHSYVRKSKSQRHSKQVICGYTCMEHDRLFEAYDEPALMPGDRIVYEKVGAYTMCLTPLFIKFFPDVYVEENGKITNVRKAWKTNEYIMNSMIEEL